MKVNATPTRTLVKALTWRITATIITFLLVLLFSKDVSIALTVGALEFILKLLAYYAHDRAWLHINWGRKAFDPVKDK